MKYLLISIILLSIIGCSAVVKYVPFDNEYHSPTKSVSIFSTPESVKREYKEIGLITASDDGWDKSEADLIKSLQKKAMEIGADAIILQSSDQVHKGYVPIGGMPMAVSERISRAIAIKFVEVPNR